MRKSIQKLSVLLLAMFLVVGMIPASVMASSDPIVSYCTHVQNEGWQDYKSNGVMSGTEGKSYRLEGIKIILDAQGYDLGISYQTHIQNIGWEADTSRGWKANDDMSGTEGLSYRLEAIQIKLTGTDASKFDIYYQVHAQNIGWMGWAKNGESAGSAGFGYRLEGIRIKIVPAGSVAPGSTENAYIKDMVLANKQAYRYLVHQAYQQYLGTGKYCCYYSLFDMDSNGIPELILNKGTCEADNTYYIYTYENNQVKLLGTINSSHSVLYGKTRCNSGQLIQVKGHMLHQQVYEVYLNNGVISQYMFLTGEVGSISDFYQTNYPLSRAYAYDLSLLN